MDLRLLVRTTCAVAAATFLAGAAVSLRLHLRHGTADWPQVASQGMEVLGWFALFALAGVLAATWLARSWPVFPGRRLVLGLLAYALAFTLFVLALSTTYPDVGTDLLANLYLAAGSFAGALAGPPTLTRPRHTDVAAAA